MEQDKMVAVVAVVVEEVVAGQDGKEHRSRSAIRFS
jgi:hypothetical protein